MIAGNALKRKGRCAMTKTTMVAACSPLMEHRTKEKVSAVSQIRRMHCVILIVRAVFMSAVNHLLIPTHPQP